MATTAKDKLKQDSNGKANGRLKSKMPRVKVGTGKGKKEKK